MAPKDATSETAVAEFDRALGSFTLKAFDNREFVLVSRLKDWLRGIDENTKKTRVQKLLKEVYKDRDFLPITAESVCRDSLRVFSILLEIKQGHLIDEFSRLRFVDDRLPFALAALKQELEAERSRNGVTTTSSEPELFDSVQWKYCAPTFHVESNLTHPQQCILPVCRRKTINEKGGTAHLWEIEVPAEFVGDSLRQQVKNSGYRSSSQHGIDSSKGQGRGDQTTDAEDWFYRFALKSFVDHSKELFYNEKQAFDALRGQKGMVKRLATFSCQDPGHPSHSALIQPNSHSLWTHNILFEYGEMDLDEYFVQNHPPFLHQEILTFWETLFEVVGPVEAIHDLKTQDDGSSFQGWHADIKPDNILLVNEKFKLADPGFAKFIKKRAKDPREVISGGTWTYGAPERCHGRREAVTRKIDIWSLGCVFSIAATWVIGGLSAVRDFSRVRKKAIERLKPSSKVLSDSESGDCFHDGTKVLDDVAEWHKILRRSARVLDRITCQVLDLVDGQMLCPDHERLSATDLRGILRNIVDESRSHSSDDISSNIMRALHEINEEAPPVFKKSSAWLQFDLLEKAEDRKARKSIVMGLPMKRTAQRSEYLKSALSDESRKLETTRTPKSTTGHHVTFPSGHALTKTPSTPISSGPPTRQSTIQTLNSIQSAPDSMVMSPTLQREGSVLRPHEPQDVFQAQKQLDKEGSYWKRRKEDDILTKYIRDRDIVFLVDNAGTMKPHWAHVEVLHHTLVRKLRHQDKDGMDLYFTLGQSDLEAETKPAQFRKSMQKAEPQHNEAFHTDMEATMGKVLSKRLNRMNYTKKDLTLIIFTDGIWKGTTNPDAIHDKIVSAVKAVDQINGPHRKRSLTFQFVQFGNDEEATYRLQYLDNVLAYDRQIPDVVDTEHAHGDVYKMILGSFIEEYDFSEDQATSPPTSNPKLASPEYSGQTTPTKNAGSSHRYH